MATSIGFDIFAKDTASSKFDSLGDTIENTSTKADKMRHAFKVAGAAVAAGAGVAAVALFGMTKAAIEDEAAQQKLALGLKNATGATDAQVTAAEKWIAAQGKALGVTDDELRPALQKLAQSTGDVGKAQDQLKIAMDVSAGSGKSLATVTEAIMKANNGSVGGLSRLGIATKNAAGETMSLDQIMAKAANTFEGQAAAKATTLGGKIDILKVRFDETKEAIGAKLIPVLMTLSGWIIGTGIPAVEKFTQQWKDGEGAGGRFAAAFDTIKTAVSGTASFLMEHKNIVAGVVAAYVGFQVAQLAMATASAVSLLALKAQTAGTLTHGVVTAAVAVKTGLWTAAQWLLNAALTANPIGIVIVALAALGVGLAIAWKKSETFRAVVIGSWNAIKGATGAVWGWVQDKVAGAVNFMTNLFLNFTGPGLIIKHWATIRERTIAAWDAIRGVVSEKLSAIQERVSGAGEAVRERISAAWSSVRERTSEAWSAVVSAVGEKISNVVEKVGTIKDRVLGAVSGFGTMLYNAGSELVQGLINGITAKIGALTAKMAELASKVKGYLPGSPVKTGPLTSWNNGGAGKRLVGLLADGLSDTAPVDAAMDRLASHANLAASGSLVMGSSGGGGMSRSASFAGGGDTYHFTITSNDPDAVVAAIQQYVKRNGKLRNVATV